MSFQADSFSLQILHKFEDGSSVAVRDGFVCFQILYCQVVAVLGLVNVDILPQRGVSVLKVEDWKPDDAPVFH
jgi:hypothetical protein